MNEEERQQIEQGVPESVGEAVMAIGFLFGIISLITFIICGVLQ